MGAQGASCTFHDNTIFARCEILHLHLIQVPSTTFTGKQKFVIILSTVLFLCLFTIPIFPIREYLLKHVYVHQYCAKFKPMLIRFDCYRCTILTWVPKQTWKIGGRVGAKSLPLLVSPNQGNMCMCTHMHMIVMKFHISLGKKKCEDRGTSWVCFRHRQLAIFLLVCLLSAWILPRNVNKNALNGALHISSTSILEHLEFEIGNYCRFFRN
jgi:hypothetical protein